MARPTWRESTPLPGRPCTDRLESIMRIIVTGDRYWACHKLAADILHRLVRRYGPDIVIVHGAGTGVEESFATACAGLGIAQEAHPVSDREWQMRGERAVSVRNQWMIDLGAGMCL